MADVAEHDSEKEGEGDDCEEGWIGLLIVGDSVGLNDFLGGSGESVGGEVRGKPMAVGRDELPGRQVQLGLQVLQKLMEFGHVCGQHKDVALEEVVEEVHFVEVAVEFFLFHEVQFQVLVASEETALHHRLSQLHQEFA